MNKVSIAGAVAGAVFLVIGLEYLLIIVFDVGTDIMQSLKYLIPIIVAIGLILITASFVRSKTMDKKERKNGNN